MWTHSKNTKLLNTPLVYQVTPRNLESSRFYYQKTELEIWEHMQKSSVKGEKQPYVAKTKGDEKLFQKIQHSFLVL